MKKQISNIEDYRKPEIQDFVTVIKKVIDNLDSIKFALDDIRSELRVIRNK